MRFRVGVFADHICDSVFAGLQQRRVEFSLAGGIEALVKRLVIDFDSVELVQSKSLAPPVMPVASHQFHESLDGKHQQPDAASPSSELAGPDPAANAPEKSALSKVKPHSEASRSSPVNELSAVEQCLKALVVACRAGCHHC